MVKHNWVKGSAKEAVFCQGSGDLINISLNVDDLQRIAAANPEKHSKGYVRITISRKKAGVDEYGNSHSIFEDEYTPKPKAPGDGGSGYNGAAKQPKEDDGLPF